MNPQIKPIRNIVLFWLFVAALILVTKITVIILIIVLISVAIYRLSGDRPGYYPDYADNPKDFW
jgi:hypothetical protein